MIFNLIFGLKADTVTTLECWNEHTVNDGDWTAAVAAAQARSQGPDRVYDEIKTATLVISDQELARLGAPSFSFFAMLYKDELKREGRK